MSIRAQAVLTSLLLLTASGPASAQSERLEELLDAYRGLKTVHLQATAVVSLSETGRRVSGDAKFEYWDTGRRYRARCHSDPSLQSGNSFALSQDADFAYNGKLAQHWDLSQNLLSIGRRESRLLPLALPNPFVLPVAFLIPDSRDCRGCKIGLTEIRPADFDELAEDGRIYWESGSDESIRIEGTPLGGRALDATVALIDVDGVTVVERIERRFEGERRQVVELYDHEAAGESDREAPFLFPRRIVLSDYGPNKAGDEELQIRTEYTIDLVEIDVKIPRTTFGLMGDRTTAIYDRELRRFIRRPGAEDSNEPLPGIRIDNQ